MTKRAFDNLSAKEKQQKMDEATKIFPSPVYIRNARVQEIFEEVQPSIPYMQRRLKSTLVLLAEFAHSIYDLEELNRIIEEEGYMLETRNGQIQQHPALQAKQSANNRVATLGSKLQVTFKKDTNSVRKATTIEHQAQEDAEELQQSSKANEMASLLAH